MSAPARSIQRSASHAIKALGSPVTLVCMRYGRYDPDTGAVPEYAQGALRYKIKGVFQNVKQSPIEGFVEYGGKRLIIAAYKLPVVPQLKDRIESKKRTYEIVKVDVQEQDDLDLTYELYLKG